MKNILTRMIEILNKNKKKIFIGVSILGVVIIAGGAVGTGIMYKKAKSNINYTEEQAKEIALANTPGEVVKVEKDIELDEAVVKYEFKIKDSNNILREVTVDAKFGAITDFDKQEDEYSQSGERSESSENVNNKVEAVSRATYNQ